MAVTVRQVLMVGVFAVAALLPSPAAAQTETPEYYGLDTTGSVRVVFDGSGAVLTRVDYGPFGEQLAAAPGAPNEKYAGLFRDEETGLDYAQARQYSPRTGRFTTVDPVYAGLFEPQRWNRYAYALNSPLGMVDSSGLEAQTVNCSLGTYWCPGQIIHGSDSDKYFDPGQYGYHGGEIAQAEAAYAANVAGAFIQRYQSSRPNPSVTTSERFSTVSSGQVEQGRALAVAGGIALADSPAIGPADVVAILYIIAASIDYFIFNADNSPTGPRAPGQPGPGDGFAAGKDGGPWVRNPNGAGSGWRAKDGGVWVPTGPRPSRAHGGPHWDVQYPGGGYVNRFPGGGGR